MKDEECEPYFDDLDFDKKIFVLVSGGRDSTAIVLGLWDHCVFHNIDTDNITLLFGDTRITKISSRNVIDELVKRTGFKLQVARYDGEEKPIAILNRAFMKLPEAIERKNRPKGKGTRSYKNLFECCEVLKKRPMTEAIRMIPKEDSIVILGIKGGDNAPHRRFRMRELRDKKTYYRLHTSHVGKGLLYYYPLRDCESEDVARVLERYGFGHIGSSGCNMCPIFLVARRWDKRDEDTYRRSLSKAKRLGIKLEKFHEDYYRAECSSVQEVFE